MTPHADPTVLDRATAAGVVDIEELIASQPAEDAPPAVDASEIEEHPGLAVARIGRACYGERWHGKLAIDIGEDHRTVRRWELGECRPTDKKLARVAFVARAHIARIERALGKL